MQKYQYFRWWYYVKDFKEGNIEDKFTENLDGSEFNKESFTEKANFDLVSCRSGLGKLVENISKLTKGTIRVYNVRVQWGTIVYG